MTDRQGDIKNFPTDDPNNEKMIAVVGGFIVDVAALMGLVAGFINCCHLRKTGQEIDVAELGSLSAKTLADRMYCEYENTYPEDHVGRDSILKCKKFLKESLDLRNAFAHATRMSVEGRSSVAPRIFTTFYPTVKKPKTKAAGVVSRISSSVIDINSLEKVESLVKELGKCLATASTKMADAKISNENTKIGNSFDELKRKVKESRSPLIHKADVVGVKDHGGRLSKKLEIDPLNIPEALRPTNTADM